MNYVQEIFLCMCTTMGYIENSQYNSCRRRRRDELTKIVVNLVCQIYVNKEIC